MEKRPTPQHPSPQGVRIALASLGVALLPLEPVVGLMILAVTRLTFRTTRSIPLGGAWERLRTHALHPRRWHAATLAWAPPLGVGVMAWWQHGDPWLLALAASGWGFTRVAWVPRSLFAPVLTATLVAMSIWGVGALWTERLVWNDEIGADPRLSLTLEGWSQTIERAGPALAASASWRVAPDTHAMHFGAIWNRRVERAGPPVLQGTNPASVATANSAAQLAGNDGARPSMGDPKTSHGNVTSKEASGRGAASQPSDGQRREVPWIEAVWRDSEDRNVAREEVAVLEPNMTSHVDVELRVPSFTDVAWLRLLVWLPEGTAVELRQVRMRQVGVGGAESPAARRAPSRWTFGTSHPNLAGHGLTSLALSAMALAPSPAWQAGVWVAGAGAVLLSGSRAALAVLLVAGAALVGLRLGARSQRGAPSVEDVSHLPTSQRAHRRGALVGALVTASALITITLGWWSSDLSRDVRLTSLTERPAAARLALAIIADHPFTGMDVSFAEAYCSTYVDASTCLTHPHNLLLDVGVRAGVPGLLALLWMGSVVLLAAWRSRRGSYGIAVMAILALNLVDPSLSEPMVLAAIGLLLTYVRHPDLHTGDDVGRT